MRKMMTMTATALVAVLTVSGCADTGMSDTQRRTAIGTGVGAVAGAVIASATGGKAGVGAVAGAAIGGAIGGGAGIGGPGVGQQLLVFALHLQQFRVLRLGLQAALDHGQGGREVAAPIGGIGQVTVQQGHTIEPGQGLGVVRRPAEDLPVVVHRAVLLGQQQALVGDALLGQRQVAGDARLQYTAQPVERAGVLWLGVSVLLAVTYPASRGPVLARELLACELAAVAVVAIVAIPARREGREVLTPRGEEMVEAVRDLRAAGRRPRREPRPDRR